MPNCCVPFCTNERGKTKGISFHEFPVDEDLKNNWLKAISRDNFVPNSYSNSSLVCSEHFTINDYTPNLKRKLLKRDSVPSKFPNYPTHKIPPVLKPRRCIVRHNLQENTKKRKRSNSPLEEQGFIADSTEYKSTDVQTDEDFDYKLKSLEKENRALKTKIWRLNHKLARVDQNLRKLSDRTEYLENNEYHRSLESILSEENHSKKAILLLDVIINYNKKTPRWSEETVKQCVIWQYCSPKGYKYAREYILRLPSTRTLSRFVGDVSLETGVTPLIKSRLTAEASSLKKAELICSLVVDEMSIKQQLQYDNKLDSFFGERDHLPSEKSNDNNSEKGKVPALANRLLCFMICGLSTRYRLPAGYFFTKQLTGSQLYMLTMSVIHDIEECGFVVLRLVADNHKTNVTMMKKFSGSRSLKTDVPHPEDPRRSLFLAFDQCHILKNLRSLFLERIMFDGHEIISGDYVKKLYEIQELQTIRPVHFLSRKHVDPTNFEKMNVRRAKEVFSPEVISALKFLKDNPHVHSKAEVFSSSGATIAYMESILRWFTLHDVSSTTHHSRIRNPDKMHYFSIDDERLCWLENEFPQYLESIKRESQKSENQFLTNETFEALILTTASTVKCVRYLLNDGFHFVLTRSFNSDPIELFFSGLRQTAGGNDMLDCRAVTFSMNKVLKTGLISIPSSTNIDVQHGSLPIWNSDSFPETTATEENSGASSTLPDHVVKVLTGLEQTQREL